MHWHRRDGCFTRKRTRQETACGGLLSPRPSHHHHHLCTRRTNQVRGGVSLARGARGSRPPCVVVCGEPRSCFPSHMVFCYVVALYQANRARADRHRGLVGRAKVKGDESTQYDSCFRRVCLARGRNCVWNVSVMMAQKSRRITEGEEATRWHQLRDGDRNREQKTPGSPMGRGVGWGRRGQARVTVRWT